MFLFFVFKNGKNVGGVSTLQLRAVTEQGGGVDCLGLIADR